MRVCQACKITDFSHPNLSFHKCSKCESENQDQVNQIRSKHKANREKPIKCPYCPKVFNRNSRLKGHLSVHRSDKPFTCSTCYTGFKTNSALRRHIRSIHEQIQKFLCDECGKEFNNKNNYIVHMKRHTSDFVIRCEHCNEGFVTKAEYRRHLDANHNRKEEVCDMCGKSVATSYLKQHRKTHDTNYEDLYYQECTICNKKFRHLKKHIRESHEGEGNNYICHTCGKSFRGDSSLKIHLMIHNGERPFQCDFCCKNFYSKQCLTVHLRVHTGEKPYACEICGKRFAQKPPLKIHMRLHSGERPYACDVCEEKFVSRQKMNFHKKSDHHIVSFKHD